MKTKTKTFNEDTPTHSPAGYLLTDAERATYEQTKAKGTSTGFLISLDIRRGRLAFAERSKADQAERAARPIYDFAAYEIGGVSVLHPDDPRSLAGIPDTLDARRIIRDERDRPARGPYTALTRAQIVEDLWPDMDGRLPGTLGLKGEIAKLYRDEIPASLYAVFSKNLLRSGKPFDYGNADKNAPMDDAETLDFLGQSLYRHRSLFSTVKFVTETDISTLAAKIESDRLERLVGPDIFGHKARRIEPTDETNS